MSQVHLFIPPTEATRWIWFQKVVIEPRGKNGCLCKPQRFLPCLKIMNMTLAYSCQWHTFSSFKKHKIVRKLAIFGFQVLHANTLYVHYRLVHVLPRKTHGTSTWPPPRSSTMAGGYPPKNRQTFMAKTWKLTTREKWGKMVETIVHVWWQEGNKLWKQLSMFDDR